MVSEVASANRILLELLRRFDDELEAYIETLEILNGPKFLDSIRGGLKDLEEGRTLSLKEFAAKHGLEAKV